jgi:hypothetical protein
MRGFSKQHDKTHDINDKTYGWTQPSSILDYCRIQHDKVIISIYWMNWFNEERRSFIMIRKRIGPKPVPWGTPPSRIFHSDTKWGILTRWLRRVRKLLIQFVINDGTSISDNLLRRMLWSIWSKYDLYRVFYRVALKAPSFQSSSSPLMECFQTRRPGCWAASRGNDHGVSASFENGILNFW